MIKEVIKAKGHPNIRALHKTTIEITKDDEISPKGDCIIATSADKAANELARELRESLKSSESILLVIIEVEGFRDLIIAQGHPNLIMSDNRKIIIRRSEFIEPATIGIRANKAAADIKRELISLMRRRDVDVTIKLISLRLNEIDPEYISTGRMI
ncbi:MAG: DUF371 domain-containing protein [Desulfurococcaceae archaeon]